MDYINNCPYCKSLLIINVSDFSNNQLEYKCENCKLVNNNFHGLEYSKYQLYIHNDVIVGYWIIHIDDNGKYRYLYSSYSDEKRTMICIDGPNSWKQIYKCENYFPLDIKDPINCVKKYIDKFLNLKTFQ